MNQGMLLKVNTFAMCSLILFYGSFCAPAFAGGGSGSGVGSGGDGVIHQPPAPAPAPTPVPIPQNFTPPSFTQELQRTMTPGNPMKVSRHYTPNQVPPIWLKRPKKIPKAYHGHKNNGEVYLP